MSKRFSELSLSDAPKIVVIPPGPKSRELIEFQNDNESSVVSYPKGMPMAIARAKGATIEDVDGNVYIDMFGGAGVMAVGHAHPEALKAAHEAIDQYTHTLDIPTPIRREMVQTLRRFLPKGLSRIFFGGPTGSDAVEQAIKLARYNTGRHSIIAFHGAYHGMTGVALGLTSDSSHRTRMEPLYPGIHFIPYDYKYRTPFGGPVEDSDLKAAEYLDMVLTNSHSGFDKPAAVIMESVQGEAGTIIPSPRFMRAVREITRKHHVLLICDEIQSGLGRTGKMLAFEHAGADFLPDIITMSKALGGLGFPISAIAYREDLNTWTPGASIGTFRGNMVAFAAGAAALDFMLDNDIPGYATELGAKMLGELKKLEAESSILGEARGIGLMFGLEIVRDKKTKEPASDLAKRVRTYAHRRGVMIEIGGHHSNVARLLPPLIIPEDLAMKGVQIIGEVIREIENER